MQDDLAAVDRDAGSVAGDSIELNRAGEVDADGVSFDEICRIQIVASQHTRSGNTRGVVIDMLTAHARA